MFSHPYPHLPPTGQALPWAVAFQGQLLLPGSPHPHVPPCWWQSAQVVHFLHSHHLLGAIPGLCVLYTVAWLYSCAKALGYSQYLQERQKVSKKPKTTPQICVLSQLGHRRCWTEKGVRVSDWGSFQSTLPWCIQYQLYNFRGSNKIIIS